MVAASEIRAGLLRGLLVYKEKSRHIPVGLLFGAAGPTFISVVVAYIFAHDQVEKGGRFEFVLIAFFSFMLLQVHFFSAFGESWRDKRHILCSNFTLLEISLSHLFTAIVQIIVFLFTLFAVFGVLQPYLLYFFVFSCWIFGLYQFAYVCGSWARWIGRITTMMGRAFFILSPIVWTPVNERQMLLAEYNPLVILLRGTGISWDGDAYVVHGLVFAAIPPLALFGLLTRRGFRRRLCARLY